MKNLRTIAFLSVLTALCAIFYSFYIKQPKIPTNIPALDIILQENKPIEIPAGQPEKKTEKEVIFDNTLGFTNVEHEVVIDALALQGKVPSWLKGSLLRNGPGQFSLNSTRFNNFYDGFAMIHRFTFENGTVSYANKFLETKYRTKALKKGCLPNTFQERKKSSIFSALGKLFTKAPEYDNANANITHIGNEVAAITETPFYISFDPHTLTTKGRISFDDKLEGHLVTAHPLTDYATHETFNILTSYGSTSTYSIFITKPGSTKRTSIATISTKNPSYIHSFGLTQHYVVLMLMPFIVNPYDLMFSNKAFIDNFIWKPEEKTEVILIDRKTGKQAHTYKIDPFFFFHTINCFEKENKVSLDVIGYQDYRVVYTQKVETMRQQARATFQGQVKRITLDLITKNALTENREIFFEQPQINEQYKGKPYSFVYGTDIDQKTIYKYNMQTQKIMSWHENGSFVGEPIFVAQPNSTQEDNGVLLSVALDAQKKHSYLLILDAQAMQEVARALLPHHIPFGFHGKFFSKS